MSKTTVLGLTGQTGAGKSNVSAIFSERKIPVVDADQVARDVVDNGKQCLADLCFWEHRFSQSGGSSLLWTG